MNILSKIVVAASILAISACSSDKVPLEGERISVLQGRSAIQADTTPEATKISLPRPSINNKWSQKGGNSEHVMQHVMSSRNLAEVWDASFGRGDSKRDFLIAEPIIAHNVVFAIDAEGIVSAFRQDSGDRIWKKRLKPRNKSDRDIALKGAGIAVFDKTLYATTGFGGIFALDMKTGKTIWRYDAETPIRVAPTVGAGKLFAQTIDNLVLAIDTTTGKEIWKQKANAETTTLVGGASAAYDANMDVVIIAFTSGELRAFKASTGSPLWSDFLVSRKRTNSLANINAIKANPVIDNGVVYAAGNDSIFVAIDMRTGSRIWEKEIGMNNQPWVAGKYLFGVSNTSDLFAMDKTNGKIIWSVNIPTATNLEDKVGVFVSGPILTNNRLVVATSNGYAFAVSPYVGKILGFITLDDGVVLPPIVANEMVIFTTNDAELLAYK